MNTEQFLSTACAVSSRSSLILSSTIFVLVVQKIGLPLPYAIRSMGCAACDSGADRDVALNIRYLTLHNQNCTNVLEGGANMSSSTCNGY